MSKGQTRGTPSDVPHRRETPVRRGLLLTLRERLENEAYEVPSDKVAASIIERAMMRNGNAAP